MVSNKLVPGPDTIRYNLAVHKVQELSHSALGTENAQ